MRMIRMRILHVVDYDGSTFGCIASGGASPPHCSAAASSPMYEIA